MQAYSQRISRMGRFYIVFCTQALEDDTRKRTLQELGAKVVHVELDFDGEIFYITVM